MVYENEINLIKVQNGKDGIGKNGKDGKTLYTWVKYSQYADGTDLTDDPTDAIFIGIAYNKEEQTESNIKTDYTWSKIKGDKGEDGIPGANGTSSYFHIKYADSYETISNMYDTPKSTTQYMGVLSTSNKTAPTNPNLYNWSLIKGADGENGSPGASGKDGKTSYLHIKYSNDGMTFTDNFGEDIGTYIGTYVDYIEQDSIIFSDYTWKKFVGEDGENGKDGTSVTISSTSITYQASSSGTTTPTGTWSTSVPSVSNGQYLWTKTVVTYSDNTSTIAYSVAYKGTNGINGNDGKNGTDGKDAAIQSATEPSDKSYMWLDTSLEPPLLKRWNGTEWEAINDTSGIVDSIDLLSASITSTIQNTSDAILLSVSNNYYSQKDANEFKTSVSTELKQTAEDVTIKFNEVTNTLKNVSDSADTQFKQINKYIRFVDGNIILGESGNELTLKIQNDRISFLESDVEVAYFSNRKLYITDGEFLNSLQLGRFAFMPRTNGNLSFNRIIGS